MKWVKRIGVGILVIIGFFIVLYFSQIIYGAQQLSGQLKIIRGAVPISQYLSDPDKPDSIKNQLRLVQEIRQFAFDSLGLKKNDNYTTVYDQRGKDVLWVVTASKPYMLEPKVWKFLFLGEVSYKGYFSLERTLDEASFLKKEGWDVSARPVTAWSTLGWFNDPILTNMLSRTEGELAELIIHELTHGTLFVKDSVDFNENLASFIGEKGAELYLVNKYGTNSSEYNNYISIQKDNDKLSNYMLLGASRLDSLYKSFDASEDTVFMLNKKNDMINRIVSNLDTVSFHDSQYKNIFQRRLPNNAYFMSFIRYKSKGNLFEKILVRDFDNDIKRFLQFYKSNYPSL